jgi:hypothetical protein
VKVHNDALAAESARAVGARAYTIGSDIAFGSGQYSPNTFDGRRLIAHELTHVMQQTYEPDTNISMRDGISISNPGDVFEQEARENAERVISSARYTQRDTRNPVPLAYSRPGLANSILQRQENESSAARALGTAANISSIIGTAAGLGSLAVSFIPSSSGGLNVTNLNFNLIKDDKYVNKPMKFHSYSIIAINSKDDSFAVITLDFTFDGRNIISAITRDLSRGYTSGFFGTDEASVILSVSDSTPPGSNIAKATIAFSGTNNPVGAGFQRFAGEINVYGDGIVHCKECFSTNGQGSAEKDPLCRVGFDLGKHRKDLDFMRPREAPQNSANKNE